MNHVRWFDRTEVNENNVERRDRKIEAVGLFNRPVRTPIPSRTSEEISTLGGPKAKSLRRNQDGAGRASDERSQSASNPRESSSVATRSIPAP
jgi:hypothetical protein